jgi:hypothetical protein
LLSPTRVNGEVRQDAAVSQLIFDIPTLIETLSRVRSSRATSSRLARAQRFHHYFVSAFKPYAVCF